MRRSLSPCAARADRAGRPEPVRGMVAVVGAACHVCHVVCADFPLCRAARPAHNLARAPTDHPLTDRHHAMHTNPPSPSPPTPPPPPPATAGPTPRPAYRPIALIGAPTDIGAGVRGASMGPEALR